MVLPCILFCVLCFVFCFWYICGPLCGYRPFFIIFSLSYDNLNFLLSLLPNHSATSLPIRFIGYCPFDLKQHSIDQSTKAINIHFVYIVAYKNGRRYHDVAKQYKKRGRHANDQVIHTQKTEDEQHSPIKNRT